ncbi:MAG: hypothetical protein ACJAWN_001891 [Neolewinella sp.]|jgi:hypothetical protein
MTEILEFSFYSNQLTIKILEHRVVTFSFERDILLAHPISMAVYLQRFRDKVNG